MWRAIPMVIGLGGMFAAMHVDYRRLLTRPMVYLALLVSTGLLILVLAADQSHQVHRWLKVGMFQVQPSEIAKLALVLYLAYQLADKESKINDLLGTVLPCAVVVGQLAFLVYLEPDMGTAALYLMLLILLLF